MNWKVCGGILFALAVGFVALAVARAWFQLNTVQALIVAAVSFLFSSVPVLIKAVADVYAIRKAAVDIEKTKLEINKLKREQNLVKVAYSEVDAALKAHRKLTERTTAKPFVERDDEL